MAELANVWVTILPDTSKIAPKVKKAFSEIEKQAAEAGKKSGKDIADGITKGGAGDKLGKDIKDGLDKAGKAAESAGDKAGKGFSSHFTKWFKGPAAKAGGEAGVNAGKMFADGFKKHSAKIGLAAGAVTGAIGLIGKSSVEYAAEAEQSYGAVESIFGKHADVITDASKQAADAVGLSGREYREMASSMGAMLGNIGTPVDEVAGKTKDLVGLGADLAATFGGPTSDAVGAISALLRGETDPIERYGVSIKQADLQARMAADGMKDLTGDAKKQAQAQTLLKMLTEQSAGAVGQFGRETDTAAHKQQVANAKIGEAKEKIGTLLLPVMSKLADAFAKFADAAAKHPKLFTAIGVAIGGAALAISAAAAVAPILTAWSVAASAAGVSMGALAGSMVAAALPFVAIAAAVVAVGVALWAFFTKTKTGRKVWKALVFSMKHGWEMIKTAFTVGTIILAKKVMGMIQHFQIFKARVSAAFQQVKNKFTAFVNGVKSIPGKIKAAFAGAGQWLLDAGKAIIRGLANGIRAAGHVISDAVRAVVPDAMEKFVPGLSIGGVIPAFARGGVLPDIPGVSRSQRDPILGWSADRKRPVARVEPGEFIVNREATARHLPLLAAINGGRLNPRKGDLGLPGYADGGVVGFSDVMRLLKGGYGAPGSLEHARYTWAGGLMANWGDCSGLQSAIASLVAGVTLAGRKFSTATQAAWLSANQFIRGLGPKKNAYAVGFLNGGPGGGHTAGTIYDGNGNAVNVEMGGRRGDGQIGGQAAGAADFPNVFWHPLKAAARVLSTSLDGAKVDTGDGAAKEVDWGSAASLFDETKKRFGVFDTGGLLASGNAAVNLSGRPERVLPPQLTTIFDRFVQLLMAGGSGGAPGGSGILRYTQLVRDAEKGLAQTRQKSGVTAKEVAAAEETVRLAQVTAAKDTATTVAGVFRSPLDSLSKLAEMSGNQQAIIATQVLQAAKQIAEVISGLVVDVFQAMSAAAGVVADHFAALREQGKAVADLRATIVGLGIDFVKAQIDMAAAARQRRLTEVSGQVAVAEAIASVAQRQAAFDAQRKADAKAQLALYDDLSAGLDRFRWNMAGGFQQAMGDMAAWSDESHALYSELLAAQTGIQLAQQVAAKNNLEAVYKQVEASFKLSDAVQGLQFAAKQLQIMSKNHFGMDQAGATAGERYAQLTQELAEIEAKKADIKTWGNPANWFNGYYDNANRRQAQIRAELDKLATSKEFQAAGIDRSMVDKIVASAGASGFFGAGDQIGDLIKNSALGDATRALQRAEYEKRQLEIEKQKADLGTQVSKGRAEVDYLAKLQPLQDLIESLQLEKASHESAAKGWREKNEDVRRAYMRVSATQAEGAQKIVQIPDGKTAFSFDEVQDIITELGGSLEQIQGRVQRLEVPPVSGGTLIKTRRG